MGSQSRIIAFVTASPLIYLGQIGRISLLRDLFSETITSTTIFAEITKKKDAPELPEIQKALKDWIKVKKVSNLELLQSLLATNVIHEGEATVLALALEGQEIEKKVILDDYLARQVAFSLNLKVIGTAGILLLALKRTLLSKYEFKRDFRILCERTSYRISVELYNEILNEADNISQS